jgi:glycosyltransferase involved in cell wall biosynthesis
MYKFSLLLPTLGRTTELDIFFKSLVNQTYKNFEVIVVDQNVNREVENIVNEYKKILNISYMRSGIKGLSYNRNIALEKAKGDIIAFPDDDCEYEKDTLEKINEFFSKNDYTLYTCNTKEKHSNYSIANALKFSSEITKSNFYRTGISFTIFHKKNDINLKFDEKLGVGAEFGAGEESDYLLKLLDNGYKGYYFHNHYIYHPYKKNEYNENRAYNYGRGFGALYKKHIFYEKKYIYSLSFFKYILRNIAAIIISKNKKYYLKSLKGKLEGFYFYTLKNK